MPHNLIFLALHFMISKGKTEFDCISVADRSMPVYANSFLAMYAPTDTTIRTVI